MPVLAILSILVVGLSVPAMGSPFDEDFGGDPFGNSAFGEAFDHPVFSGEWSPFEITDDPETVEDETEETIDETEGFDEMDESEFGGVDETDETEADETDSAQEDIAAAQRASAEADACTAEFAVMQSPYDSETTFDATDGCMIAALEERGWERTQTTGPAETGSDFGDGVGETDETDETDSGFDEGTGDEPSTVSEEAYLEPAPGPGDAYYEAGTSDWVSYINPRDAYRSTYAGYEGEGSGKICVTLLNEDGDHIIGESVPNTQVTIPTGDELAWHPYADPMTVNFPMDVYHERPLDADQFGTTPELPQGDGYMDSHCIEWHDLADDATVTYGEATITGDHADDVEVVGYVQQAHDAWDTNVDPIADAESYEAAGGGWTMYPGGSHGQVVVVLQLTG